MRRKPTLLIAGLALAVGLAGPAVAQPFGYYPNRSADYAYRYEPPLAYGPDGSYTGYTYFNGYDGYNSSPVTAPPLIHAWNPAPPAPTLGAIPTDVFGPNPGGMIGPDGRQIVCHVVGRWSAAWGRYVGRRECQAQ